MKVKMDRTGNPISFDNWNFEDELPFAVVKWFNEILAERIRIVFDSENGAETMIVVDVEAITKYDIPFEVGLDISGNLDNFARSETSVRKLVMDAIEDAADVYKKDIRLGVSEALLSIAKDVLKADIPGFTQLTEKGPME